MDQYNYGMRVQKKAPRVTDEDIHDIIMLVEQSVPVVNVSVIRPFLGSNRRLPSISRLFRFHKRSDERS